MTGTILLNQREERIFDTATLRLDRMSEDQRWLITMLRKLDVKSKPPSELEALESAPQICSTLENFLKFVRDNSCRPLHLNAQIDPGISADERLILDIIGGCQCGYGAFCSAMLHLIFEDAHVGQARLLCAELSAALNTAGIYVQHRLCTEACEHLEWHVPPCQQNQVLQ